MSPTISCKTKRIFMPNSKMEKKVLLTLLDKLDENFMISRKCSLGYYNVSLKEVADQIVNSQKEIEIDDFIEQLVGIFQIKELTSKYNLDDEQFIQFVNSRNQVYDLAGDVEMLNPYAKNLVVNKNILEVLKSNVKKARNLSEVFNIELKRKKEQTDNIGYIYLIKSELGCKIGKTKNIKKRYRAFSVKMPFNFEFEIYRKCNNYNKLELELHQKFDHQKINGEWFNLTAKDVQYIKTTLIKNEAKHSS